jgi:hypothetical protein
VLRVLLDGSSATVGAAWQLAHALTPALDRVSRLICPSISGSGGRVNYRSLTEARRVSTESAISRHHPAILPERRTMDGLQVVDEAL